MPTIQTVDVRTNPLLSATAATEPSAPADAKRAQLQVALLKKTLDLQKSEAAELMRMAEGKGQRLDLRV